MRGNGVGFKASKVHFSSTSVVVVFVFTEEAPEERETHGGSSRSKHLYRARGLYQPCLYTKKADKDDWLGKDDLVLFVEFCSTAQIGSSANFRVSSTFEDYILIPTGSKSFGQGTESRAGLE